jgi:probable F420-dependent oxidoreductase
VTGTAEERRVFRKVWASVDLRMPLADVPEFARRAERLGFDGIAVADAIHDGPMTAAAVVTATTRVAVRSSGFVAFARSPMTTAIAAWDLQALSGGRFELGLGPLVRSIIVDRYSMPWTPPAPRMREYIESLRAIFACWQHGAPLHYVGEHYRFTRMQDYMKPPPLEHPDMRIVVAGIGPHMTAVAGELADAINTHPTNSDPRFLREFTLPNLQRGAARSGRDVSEVVIIVNAMCATGATDTDVQRNREPIRALLATLYSTPQYMHSLDLYGWRDRGELLHRMVREGRWGELAGVITDEMLDVFAPSAPYAELASVLRERYEGLVQEIGVPVSDDPGDDEAITRLVEELRA